MKTVLLNYRIKVPATGLAADAELAGDGLVMALGRLAVNHMDGLINRAVAAVAAGTPPSAADPLPAVVDVRFELWNGETEMVGEYVFSWRSSSVLGSQLPKLEAIAVRMRQAAIDYERETAA